MPTGQNNVWTERAVSELCRKPPVAGIQFVTVRRNNWTVRVSFLHLIKYWSVWCPDNHTVSPMLSAPFQVHGEAGSLLGALWLEMISDASGPVGFWECTKSVLPLDYHTILNKKHVAIGWTTAFQFVFTGSKPVQSPVSMHSSFLRLQICLMNVKPVCKHLEWQLSFGT